MSEQRNAFKDYFSLDSDRYKRFRPVYPDALYDYLSQIVPNQGLAWDVGCGNGQAARELAKHFQQVVATDASEEQILQTHSTGNLQFFVSPAESINADPGSVDLITVAQAIHWFDHQTFFGAANQALKQGGILAVWGYQLLYTDTPLDPVIERFHTDIVGPYWPEERALLDNGYTKVPFPYPRLDTPSFSMRTNWNFGDLIGYLNTWSAVKQYTKKRGMNPVKQHFEEFRSAWGETDKCQSIYWPLILYVGRKP